MNNSIFKKQCGVGFYFAFNSDSGLSTTVVKKRGYGCYSNVHHYNEGAFKKVLPSLME